MSDKRFVYILRSDVDPGRHYTGITSNLEERLHWHNSGPSGVTIPHRPWSLVVAMRFADATTARRFERVSQDRLGSGVCEAALRLHRRIIT